MGEILDFSNPLELSDSGFKLPDSESVLDLPGSTEIIDTSKDEERKVSGDLESLAKIGELYSGYIDNTNPSVNQEAYDIFIRYLSSLDGEKKEAIIGKLLDKNLLDNIADFFSFQSGFLNFQNEADFIKAFSINIAETDQNSITENRILDNNENLKKVKNLKSILGNILDIDGLSSMFPDLLTLYNNKDLSPNEFSKEIVNYFKNLSDKDFRNLFDLINKNDQEEGTSYYPKIKQSLISVNPALKQKFIDYEKYSIITKGLDSPVISDLDKVRTASGLGTTDYNQEGTIASVVEGDTEIQIDMAQKPPKRFLSGLDSDYKLETDLPVGDFYKHTVKYEKVRMELEPKIGKLEGALTFLDSPEAKDMTIKDIQESLKQILGYTYYGTLGINGILIDKQQIKLNLVAESQRLKQELKDAQDEYRRGLKEEMDAYYIDLKEKDEKTKDMLSFIHRIGFDLIPQEITEDLFEMIRSNQIPMADINSSFNPENIDLANGHFGEPEGVDQNNIAKENIIRFLNKLVTGEPDTDITGIANTVVFNNQASIDPTKFKANMQEHGVYSIVLGFDKVKIQGNLFSTHIKKEEKK